MTQLHLHTRGRERHRDYQFLGSAPATPWWRDYADHTTFERPTILVESDGRAWQAYLSGIPSRRRDAVGTVIRWTVVAEGDPETAGPDGPASGDVLALVASWLADQDLAPGDRGRVGRVLDTAFPEPDVQRLLAADPPAEPEVRARLLGALRELRLPTAAPPSDAAGDWLADRSRPDARAAFLARVDALLAGAAGRALELNLVGAAADLAGLLADPRPLAVLAPDLPDPAAVTALVRPQAGPKKAGPPSRTRNPPASAVRNLRGCLRLVLVPIALIAALVLALLATIFYPR